jgi:hypothetical protein
MKAPLLLCFSLILLCYTPVHAQDKLSAASAQQKLNAIDKHFFIENKGQWPSEVLYLTQSAGLNTWITTKGMQYEFYKMEEIKSAVTHDAHNDRFSPQAYQRWGQRVLYQLKGNNANVEPVGAFQQEAYYNYLMGNDPSKHASNVGLYKEAFVKEVYPGIDLRYYFDNGMLRYDYIVRPGANPNLIRFSFEGTDKTSINEKGELVFTTCFGDVKNADLYCYQQHDKKQVAAKFAKQGDSWGIALGSYNKHQTLVIDPLVYSTYLGGSGIDIASDIALDASGNAFITGWTLTSDYVSTPGVFQPTSPGTFADAIVSKLNSTGSSLVYSTFIGGSGNDNASSIDVDGAGNAYISGTTLSADYDITTGAFKTISGGGNNEAFVSKLNVNGTALIYSTFIGGNFDEGAAAIKVDALGNAYITGTTNSTNFDITAGALKTTHVGADREAFITKLNATGSALIYSTYLGGSNWDSGNSITIDNSGNAYVTGYTDSHDFNTTFSSFQFVNDGSTDVFVAKINTTGSGLVYSTYLGGSGDEVGYSIAIDVIGNAYITGTTTSTNYDVTAGVFQNTNAGANDVFVSKLNSTGSALLYSTYIGGSAVDGGAAIAIDASNNAYILGTTHSTNFPFTSGAIQTIFDGSPSDLFISKLNNNGTALLYSTYLGGSIGEEGSGLQLDAVDNVYISGYTWSPDFDVTSGAFQTTPVGSYDVFVSKLCMANIALTSAPLTDSQTVCRSSAITTITYSTSGATGATFTGLPIGVTGSWASNVVTISGSPSSTGTYNYIVTLLGACSGVADTGTITVLPLNTLSSPISIPDVCIGTTMPNVLFSTTGVTGIGTATGLPAGVTASWAANIITVSGTPAVSGSFHFSIPTTGGCGALTASGRLNVLPLNTVTAASSTPTICGGTLLTPITHTTTGATGIGTATGLPPGVTASWSANTITISGTPMALGTFNYSIPLTGGCGTAIATGTIIVVQPTNNNYNTATPASSSPIVCINTAIPSITHTTTYATGIGTATGLPAGVTATWLANLITISGTPTVSGTFNYTIPLSGGCGAINAVGTITVIPDNTVSTASATPSVCMGATLTSITHTTTGATGIGTATGLPTGITATWTANTITISGTATTTAGIYNYSIPLTGGCGTVNATGTITVLNDNTVSAASASTTLCAGVAMPPITHTTTGATGIGVATGLPSGITATWASNTITISGIPTATGTFNYSIPLTGGCGIATAIGTITVVPSNTDNTVTNASSTPSICVSTILPSITHTTTGATGIGTPVGLPAGVTATWLANTITISGTPTTTGVFNYSIPLAGGCGAAIFAAGTINVNTCVAITEMDASKLFTVTPNPSYGMYQVQFENSFVESVLIEVFDLQGRLVFIKTEIGKNNVTIDLCAEPAGVYLLKGKTNNQQAFTRLIKL